MKKNTNFKNRVSLFVLLGLLLILNVTRVYGHRESTYYLSGFFGKTEVGIQIDDFGHSCIAYYFTSDDKYDRILEGTITNDHKFELFAFRWDQNKEKKRTGTRLSVKEIKRDIWEGTWRKEDGTTVAVNLKPILVDSLNNPYTRIIKKHALSPYIAYKLRDVHFVNVKKDEISKGFKIQRILDPSSQIEWFRLIEDKNSLWDINNINDKLTADHLDQINRKYSTVSMGEYGEYKLRYKIHFLNSHLLSYTVSSNTKYKNKAGKDIAYNLTLSVATAKVLSLEDLVWFGDMPKPEIKEGEYKWFQYRYKVFGPKVLELQRTQYPHIFSAKKMDCNYDDVKVWQFPHWYLTEKGLYLGSKSPNSRTKCDTAAWSVISYDQLTSYLSGDYKITHLRTD